MLYLLEALEQGRWLGLLPGGESGQKAAGGLHTLDSVMTYEAFLGVGVFLGNEIPEQFEPILNRLFFGVNHI